MYRTRTVFNGEAPPIRQYPFVEWATLRRSIDWRQGQHVLAVGGTGSGKSTVAGEFLRRRKLVVVAVSKGMDDIFEGPYYRDYETIAKWPPSRSSLHYVLLRPKNRRTIAETLTHKANVFRGMFDDILLRRGHWCIDIDEEHYMTEMLGLRKEITAVLEQGRSANISLWNNTQRPAGIPLASYVCSSHAFFFSSQEEYDVKRLGTMVNKHTHRAELMTNIERVDSFATHEHVYLDRSGRLPPVRSIVSLRRS